MYSAIFAAVLAMAACEKVSEPSVITTEGAETRFVCSADTCLEALSYAPKAGLAFDTGNFLFAGDDTMTQYEHFRSKIGHVHLKDRMAPDNMACVPAGEGCLPVKDIIRKLKAETAVDEFVEEVRRLGEEKSQATL